MGKDSHALNANHITMHLCDTLEFYQVFCMIGWCKPFGCRDELKRLMRPKAKTQVAIKLGFIMNYLYL